MIYSGYTRSPMLHILCVCIILISCILLQIPNASAYVLTKSTVSIQKDNIAFLIPKGGANAVEIEYDSDEEVDESESEYESESESEEEEEEAATLLKSTVASTAKRQKKQKEETKSTMSAVLQKQKKKRKSMFPKIRLPYLLRACLNPFTLFSMTKTYWASLINISYLEELQESQKSLRPSFEEQAKFNPTPKKGKRKFKPGQAKTLSDLPKLNA